MKWVTDYVVLLAKHLLVFRNSLFVALKWIKSWLGLQLKCGAVIYASLLLPLGFQIQSNPVNTNTLKCLNIQVYRFELFLTLFVSIFANIVGKWFQLLHICTFFIK